jgi:peptidoglycan/LPS O-acetylase OafA/YrhL
MSVEVGPDRRVVGLDGLRGLAALFVVLHHSWLMSFDGFPRNTGPFWLGWLMYGHFAVVVFIALSGFSLAISPARKGWQLGRKAVFARRRAWRILPPYWAALAFSLIIAWGLGVPQPGSASPDGKTVAVYGLLLQDVFGAPDPNGAFWSIAVEAQLYLLFPLMLLILRRYGAAAVLTAVTVPVIAIGLLAPQLSVVDKLMRLTPQFAPLFAIGIVAAGIISAGDRIRRWPLPWLAAIAALPVLTLIVVNGSAWTIGHLFWLDLAAGPAIALLLAALATRRPGPLVWLLGTPPVRSLGTFSYSLYLVHAPIVVAVATKLVAPHFARGLPSFWATVAIAVPVSLLFARVFAACFEIPFQRYRSWPALRAAWNARLGRGVAPAQAATAEVKPAQPEPTPPELAQPELAVPGLAVPGLAVPGLAVPGLAVPGLAVPAPVTET